MKFKVGDRVRRIKERDEFYIDSVNYEKGLSYRSRTIGTNSVWHFCGSDLELVENRVNVYEQWADYNDCNKESKQDTVDRLKKELEEAQKALDKRPVVNGYKMKTADYTGVDVAIFGCARIPYRFFKDIDFLNSDMKTAEPSVCNRSIKSITLDSGVEISAEQCEEVLEYFNKNK